MATQIQRVRFFDGQFLKEVDFRDEQNYHLHMRRRMNFFLFGQSGVIPLGSDDELKFFALNNVNKTFNVRAGMAICRRLDRMEGKEIILAEDSGAIDLDNHGITTGGTAYVTIHFQEEELKDPPSEGDVDENTRYREKAVLSVHSAPPPGTAPGGEEYILLGTIAYNTMAPDYTLRHEARLRAVLFQAPPAPSITSVSGTTSANPGSPAVNMVINGLNLSGASAVSFNDPAVTGVVMNATATTVSVTVTAGPAATLGVKSFQVTTPAGLASSPTGVGFTVAAPMPVITGISVHAANQGITNVSATITGSNLAGATAVTFAGTGVTATIQSGGTATTLPITISVTSSASPGPRTFTVTTPSGSASSSGVVGAEFSVTVAAPAVTSINVTTVTQGTSMSGVITGTNLSGATAVTFSGTGVTATIQSGGTATTVPITITAAANAAVGARTFTVATPNGNASSGATAVSVVFAPATVDGINIHSGTQGTTVDVIITGTNLAEASEVIFSGAGINTFIQSGVTATSLPVRLVIDASAATGARTFVVGTPRGDVSSNGVPNANFSVALGVRLISLTPALQISGGTIDLNGVNIRNSALSAGSPATGTLVQLKKSGFTKAALSPTVRPDTVVSGETRQVVRITIPDRTGTTWAAKEAVTLELTFSGVTVSLPFTYDD